MIDTIRVLVDWKCNLKCAYCCNEQAVFRDQIQPVHLEDIEWSLYPNVCITGGEPLLFMDRVASVANASAQTSLRILYTNGVYLTPSVAVQLHLYRIGAINVGIHIPSTFAKLISNCIQAVRGLPISLRFHAQDIHRERLLSQYPGVSFRFWKMNDCDRSNERRVVLIWEAAH